jgi:phosphonate transport system ATP-binding protein
VNIHDVHLARAYADRVIGIARGAILFDGHPAELDDATLDRIYQTAAQEESVGDDLAVAVSAA